jgi:hypothetical protein
VNYYHEYITAWAERIDGDVVNIYARAPRAVCWVSSDTFDRLTFIMSLGLTVSQVFDLAPYVL